MEAQDIETLKGQLNYHVINLKKEKKERQHGATPPA